MIRVVIENIVLLLLPSVLYFSYIYLTKTSTTNRQQAIDDAPFLWLFVAGSALCLAALAVFANFSGAGSPGDRYVPSIIRDGKIVPGRIERQPETIGKEAETAPIETAPAQPSP